MANTQTSPEELWRLISQAGGVERYIQQELNARGFLVERRDTDSMSKAKLKAYKKALKEEAAAKKRLKKEAWLAYRSQHILHLGDGVFWNDLSDFDKWDLENAENRAAENELPPLDSPKALAEALEIDVLTLRWLTYHREAATKIHYTPFTIPKRDGSPRQIWAPMPKLKAAQRWILRQIVERLPVHGAAHAFLPGRSIASHAAQHTQSKMVLKMDLKDFFPNHYLP